MQKFRNNKIVYNGIKFDSKLECNFYITLLQAKKENKIIDFELQPKFLLQDKFEKHGKKYRAITYIADFKVYTNDGKCHVVDCKGMETIEFKIKKKLFIKKFDFPLHCMTHITKYGGWIELDDYNKIKKCRKTS